MVVSGQGMKPKKRAAIFRSCDVKKMRADSAKSLSRSGAALIAAQFAIRQAGPARNFGVKRRVVPP
jgi:hypothetical protein